MNINLNNALQRKVNLQLELTAICQKITNTNCVAGQIKFATLQIFVSPYTLSQARFYEQEIINKFGNKFQFKHIDWRILLEEIKEKEKIKRKISPKHIKSIKTLANNCQHSVLKSALLRLGKTLNQNTDNS